MRLLLALTCAMILVDTVFYAALVPHFAEEFGLSKSSAGILSGAFGVEVLLESAPSGCLTAHLGVRPTALAGLDSVSGASSLFGFTDGAWELVVLRPQRGSGALSWVSAFTWLVPQAPEERRRR